MDSPLCGAYQGNVTTKYGKVSAEDYGQLDYVYRTKEEVQTMLAATLEQERKKIYQKGEAAGVAKGRAEGIEAQRTIILQLLRFRFELVETEQERVTQLLTKIQELQPLNQLANILLNKDARLDDFIAQLESYLLPSILNR